MPTGLKFRNKFLSLRMEKKKLNKVRITAIKQAVYPDLKALYESPVEQHCGVTLGQEWVSVDGKCPEGLCFSAWNTMREYVEALARVYADFAESLTGKKKSRAKNQRILGMTVEEGLRSVAVTTAMEKSIQFVPPEAPSPVKWQPVVMPKLEFPRVTELTKAWLDK